MARDLGAPMMKQQKITSVATILKRELEATIKEWLRRVNLVPELTDVPLSDTDRTRHLHKLYADLICRLRLAKDTHPPAVSTAAAAHGKIRREQCYSASMLIEASRIFHVSTFSTLHVHHSDFNPSKLLPEVLLFED